MAALALVGYLCWLIYSAYGLSSLPMSLLKGRRNVNEEILDVQDELAITRQRKRAVASKYLGGGRQVRTTLWSVLS
jgi:LMBR1 domain-containing protein 1